jgi:polar amino acid transport system substrate-binding protein
MPPYNYMAKDGNVMGVSTLFLETIMRKNGTPIDTSKIHVTSWSRAYEEVLSKKSAILYSAARIQEREDKFKWVGPIDKMQIGLMAKKSKHIQINSVSDLYQYKIGTMHRTTADQLVLDTGVKEENLDRFSHVRSQLKKLSFDRVDMVAFSYQAMKYLIKELGLNPDEYELVYLLEEVELYYAFSKDFDDAFIQRLNAIVKELNDDPQTSFESLKKNSCYIK